MRPPGITVALFGVTYGPAAVSAQQPDSPTGQAARPDAREFINQMSIAGMAEVQLGTLASERGTNPDVKAFGQMMVKDHLQANKELAQIAAQLKVQPPLRNWMENTATLRIGCPSSRGPSLIGNT